MCVHIMGKTTIQISKEIRDALGRQRITKRETYDEVLGRLMTKRKTRSPLVNTLNSPPFSTVAHTKVGKKTAKELGLHY